MKETEFIEHLSKIDFKDNYEEDIKKLYNLLLIFHNHCENYEKKFLINEYIKKLESMILNK